MSRQEGMAFETKAIHAGQDPEQWNSKAVMPPVSLSTTFKQRAPGEHVGYEYSRSANPTRTSLEALLASLEKSRFALTYASGTSAMSNVLHLLKTGDHMVASEYLYGGTDELFKNLASPSGIEFDFVDATNIDLISKALKPNTKLVWVETASNPMMKIVDIRGTADMLKKKAPNVMLVVDNTFMTPYFHNPLTQGADLVVHSITKYINGHSDVVMGCIMTNSGEIHDRLRFSQNAIGGVPSPFDCFLVIRGIKTLALRMEKHQENGLKIGQWLETHPFVEKVHHPGLPSHPQHELYKKQTTGSSGMLSFYLKGGLTASTNFLKALKVFTLADSLGSTESLAGLPCVSSHECLPKEKQKRLGLTDNFIRLSVGCENIDDLLEDLKQALDVASRS